MQVNGPCGAAIYVTMRYFWGDFTSLFYNGRELGSYKHCIRLSCLSPCIHNKGFPMSSIPFLVQFTSSTPPGQLWTELQKNDSGKQPTYCEKSPSPGHIEGTEPSWHTKVTFTGGEMDECKS